MEYLEKYKDWLNNPIIDESVKEELKGIEGNNYR